MDLSIDIYSQKKEFKIGVVLAAILLIAASIYYTDDLVSRLEDREEQQIQSYAEMVRYVYTRDQTKDINFFFEKIQQIHKTNTIPVILKHGGGDLESLNIELPPRLTFDQKQSFLKERLEEIKLQGHEPIQLDMVFQVDTIYYGNSTLLNQLRYYPFVQLVAVLTFGFLAYLTFSYSRRAEQNRVWVGLAKETAHQLGTPLSSLMAWVEFLKSSPETDQSIVVELEKDVQRLEVITTRFSNIGSVPVMKHEPIAELVGQFMGYLQKRISSKVQVHIENLLPDQKTAPVNKYLFEWVIENVAKNAVDAMAGVGTLTLQLSEQKDGYLAIDISDTGKGIQKQHLKKVFDPGFSTKKRGWGLGLTLAKRIIENYHDGKLVVKTTEVGKGSTFRILIPEVRDDD
jgi:signal transduction histidine kinase